MENMVPYDVAIIGGGVIGCAILHELTLKGYSCVLLEKNEDLISGASCGNSAHTLLYGHGSHLEKKLLQQSVKLNIEAYQRYNVPIKNIGALMIAKNDEEVERLKEIKATSALGDSGGLRLLTKNETLSIEPHLMTDFKGALLIPGEAVVDSWLFPVKLAHHAIRNGALIRRGWEVKEGCRTGDQTWILKTSKGEEVKARNVINAAGLYGDKVEDICHKNRFNIKPQNGQYAVFSKSAGKLINHIILPLPNKKTKGILIFPSVYGNVIVGPTAEEVSNRDKPIIQEHVIKSLVSHAHKMIPELKDHKMIGTYGGLRPATETRDYIIEADSEKNWITVGGIRSTGVSACLGIAKYVSSLLETKLSALPSREKCENSSQASHWFTDKGEVVLDGVAYQITHPIVKYGIMGNKINSKI